MSPCLFLGIPWGVLCEPTSSSFRWFFCSFSNICCPKILSSKCMAGISATDDPRHCLTTRRTTNTSKLNELGYKVFSLSPSSPGLLPTDYCFFKHLENFLQGRCFHNQQEAENAFQEFTESWGTDFYTTGISKFISHWQKCVDCNGSYFDRQRCVSV